MHLDAAHPAGFAQADAGTPADVGHRLALDAVEVAAVPIPAARQEIPERLELPKVCVGAGVVPECPVGVLGLLLGQAALESGLLTFSEVVRRFGV